MPPEPTIDQQLARRIRDLRAARGLTLDALAERAEVSRGMLSRIERAESSPTAQLLNRVCGGLGITLASLFAGDLASAGPLSRRADQPVWQDPASGYRRRQVNLGEAAPDVTEVLFPPQTRVAFAPQARSRAVQIVWLLSGTMTIRSGEEQFVLEEGDSLLTRLDRLTVFHNTSDATARYAVILGRAPHEESAT